MSDKKTLAYINLDGKDFFVGTMWSHFSRGKETSDFEYSSQWLKNKDSFSLQPALFLGAGKQVNARRMPMFGAFGDSAPDTWGRMLMRRYEAQLAKKEARQPRTLNEIDYLLYVCDYARQGALRFKEEEDGDFLYPGTIKSIPPLVKLAELLHSAEKIVSSTEKEKELAMLMMPGSSLGGARPKASVIDKQGNLCIAKFPKKDDDTNNTAWEAAALILAEKCGLNVQKWTLENVGKKRVLIVQRFDRKGQKRIPFLSAMSMINAIDNDVQPHSYIEIAEAIKMYGAAPEKDMLELWKRIVFSIAISNTDDHLRNHGFLYAGRNGWNLSPLYDVVPRNDGKNMLSLCITEDDSSQDFELALEAAEYFGIKLNQAKEITADIKKNVKNWRNAARQLGLKKPEIDKMATAFKV